MAVGAHTYRKGQPAQLCGRGSALAGISRDFTPQLNLLEGLMNNGWLNSVEPGPLVLPAGSRRLKVDMVV